MKHLISSFSSVAVSVQVAPSAAPIPAPVPYRLIPILLVLPVFIFHVVSAHVVAVSLKADRSEMDDIDALLADFGAENEAFHARTAPGIVAEVSVPREAPSVIALFPAQLRSFSWENLDAEPLYHGRIRLADLRLPAFASCLHDHPQGGHSRSGAPERRPLLGHIFLTQ